MDRRALLARAGLVATWAGIAIRISECSSYGDSSTGPSDDNVGSGDVVGTVTGAGHTHSGAVVTQAQLASGQGVTLTLTGSGHTHTVRLSAQQVMDIADGVRVSQNTEPDNTGHMHTVTFN